jgi:hypothetical protein
VKPTLCDNCIHLQCQTVGTVLHRQCEACAGDVEIVPCSKLAGVPI